MPARPSLKANRTPDRIEITVTLIYKFKTRTCAYLNSVRVDGIPIPPHVISFNEKGFRAFQILLCGAWKDLFGPEDQDTCSLEPDGFAKALYNAVRETDPYLWIQYVFGNHAEKLEHYIIARIRSKQITVTITENLKSKIKVADESLIGHRDATMEEIDIIVANLKSETLKSPIDLFIIAHNPCKTARWTICGKSEQHNIYYGCYVQINVFYHSNFHPIVYWFSNHEIYELYPVKDNRLSNVPIPSISKIGIETKLSIGELPGIPIDTKAGVEACLAISVRDPIDRDEMRNKIMTFFRANPISSYRWDQGPVKRFFNGPVSKRVAKRRLGNPLEGRDFGGDLLQEIMPEDSTSVLITLPVEPQ